MGAFLILRAAFESFRAIFGSLVEEQEQSGFIVPGAPGQRNQSWHISRPEPDFFQLPAGTGFLSAAGRNRISLGCRPESEISQPAGILST